MYEILSGVPVPSKYAGSLADTLRRMCKGDSVEIPESKMSGAYTTARLAGAKIIARRTGNGLARIWRVDGPERPKRAIDTDIFGQKNILE